MSDDNDTEESGSSPNAKRLSSETWAEIEELYATGQVKSVELAARYGVSTSTLSRRFQSRNIVWNSKPTQAAAAAVAAANAAIAAAPKKTFAERREERIDETKTRSYEIHNAVQILLGNMIREFGSKTSLPQDKMADIKALRLLAQTNEISRQGRYAILDIMPDPEAIERPTILIDDLHDDEIAKMQQEHGEDNEILEGDEEEVSIEGEDEGESE